MQGQYNMRSPAVKRLMREAQELSEPTEQYHAHPLEDNLFEWHFTIRGPADTEFESGVYHGRIVLPADYPMKPPSIILLTPNGRFETFKKICLSISGHHPESWQPSWSIRTALLAIIGFMPTHGNGAIGSLDYTSDERKVLARRTKDYKCEQCGEIRNILKPVTEASEKTNQEAKELAKQISFQGEKEKKGSTSSESKTETPPTHNAESASPLSSTPSQSTTAPTHLPQFPQQRFPMMPVGFPPFPPAMFRLPTTNSSGMPPQMMMPPPFWPGMIPPTSQQQGRMPFLPFFPPGTMMPSGAISNQQATTSQSSSSSDIRATSESSVSQQSSTSENPQTSTAASVSRANVVSKNVGEADAIRRALNDADSATNSIESQKQSSTNATNSTSSPTEAAAPQSELRRRHIGESSSASTTTTQAELNSAAAARLAAFASRLPPPSAPGNTPSVSPRRAELTRRRNERSTDGWHRCTIVLMIVIAIALVMLIMRRLIIMKIIQFDYNYS